MEQSTPSSGNNGGTHDFPVVHLTCLAVCPLLQPNENRLFPLDDMVRQSFLTGLKGDEFGIVLNKLRDFGPHSLNLLPQLRQLFPVREYTPLLSRYKRNTRPCSHTFAKFAKKIPFSDPFLNHTSIFEM
jgi:hypothetical protein